MADWDPASCWKNQQVKEVNIQFLQNFYSVRREFRQDHRLIECLQSIPIDKSTGAF